MPDTHRHDESDSCADCGFRGPSEIRLRDARGEILCDDCHSSDLVETGGSAIWFPEGSQEFLLHLHRTAHVLTVLDSSGPAGLGAARIVEDLSCRHLPIEAFFKTSDWRQVVATLDRLPEDTRERIWTGLRHLPAPPTPERIESWIEDGGTYAGFSVEAVLTAGGLHV